MGPSSTAAVLLCLSASVKVGGRAMENVSSATCRCWAAADGVIALRRTRIAARCKAFFMNYIDINVKVIIPAPKVVGSQYNPGLVARILQGTFLEEIAPRSRKSSSLAGTVPSREDPEAQTGQGRTGP